MGELYIGFGHSSPLEETAGARKAVDMDVPLSVSGMCLYGFCCPPLSSPQKLFFT